MSPPGWTIYHIKQCWSSIPELVYVSLISSLCLVPLQVFP